MKKIIETDIVIVGGGIAGLWLLNRVRQLGYSVILLESKALGAGQTNKSQGIIHGGIKYALQGMVTGAAQAIAEMPKVWEDCLKGSGVIDLSQVPILSRHQYLWSTGSLASKIAGFFAGKALKGNVEELARDAYPAIFQNPQFKGQVYSLDEIVIDVHAVIRELVKPNQDVIYKIDPTHDNQIKFDSNGQLTCLEIQAEPIDPIQIKAQKYIFTAGAGNEDLLRPLHKQGVAMQRRPLHMVIMQVDFDYALYAHCLGLGSTPRITITTHKTIDDKPIWYIGGQLAEEGVKRDAKAQIQAARKELIELFPWLDFSNAQFATFFVDRAEALQPDGKRPDSCYAKEVENVIAAWPTKLALAPKLADEIIANLARDNIKKHITDLRPLRAWPIPSLAKPVWDELL
ncbi:MAG: FAD-dependent oxidoreductase [Gammaproteobacteria bacterium]